MSTEVPINDKSRAWHLRTAMINELRRNGTVPGIEVGERAPDFNLPNQHGIPISLSENLSHGPVVLVFYRGAWCPHCDLHIRSLQGALPEIAGYGAHLITISPQGPDRSLPFAEILGLEFEVLSDLEQRTIRDYKLQFRLPDEVAEVSVGYPITEQNADGSLNLPVPATFIIDEGGIVRARHVDPNYRERMSSAEVLNALQVIVVPD